MGAHMNNFLNMFKDNKNLKYAVNIFILLVIISLILKLDTSKITDSKTSNIALGSNDNHETTQESYVYSLEKRVEGILSKIENLDNVEVMIYTKKTPEMKPVFDENTSNETNIETGGDGTKREVKRETKQNQVILGNNNQVVSKYYQYPEISGVLVVANYSGNKDIYSILMNCVKTLLDINLNDIEIVLSNK
jgi:stage III sporulation protein AG